MRVIYVLFMKSILIFVSEISLMYHKGRGKTQIHWAKASFNVAFKIAKPEETERDSSLLSWGVSSNQH